MGWQNIFAAILQAGDTTVINAAGEFLYNGTPAKGNLIASIAAVGGTDPYGNVYGEGMFLYGNSGSYIGMGVAGTQPGIVMLPPSQTHMTLQPLIFSAVTNAGLANEYAALIMSSGKESGNADAAIQLFSESADGTIAANTVFEFGGVVFMTVTQTGLLIPAQSTPTAVIGSAAVFSDQAASLAVVDGSDAQVYKTQRRTIVTGSNQPISSTTFGTVAQSQLEAPSGSSREYHIRGKMNINPSQAAGGFAIQFICTGSTTPLGLDFTWYSADNTAPAAIAPVAFVNAALATSYNPGLVMAAAHTYSVDIDCTITIPAATSTPFLVQFATPNAGDDYVVLAGSYLEIMPV
jgi:hypothetical protein